jgi:NADPH oxidase
MTWIRKLYTIRWELSYPLQRRLPLSKKILRKIGISLTWGEALLWAPFMIILIQGMLSSFVNPSVTESGLVARLPLVICFLTANHNSVLSLLLGIPFERALKYHKVSGYTAFINGIFHTYIAYVAALEEKSSNGKLARSN